MFGISHNCYEECGHDSMSDVEEAILRSQENQIKREEANTDYIEEDELGITIKCPAKKMPDQPLGYYLAVRVILRNQKRGKNERLIYIDTQTNFIRQGYSAPFQEDKQTLLRLAAFSYTRPGATAYAWEYLHEMLPKLDKSKLVIFPGLLFDRETGALIKTDGKELTV